VCEYIFAFLELDKFVTVYFKNSKQKIKYIPLFKIFRRSFQLEGPIIEDIFLHTCVTRTRRIYKILFSDSLAFYVTLNTNCLLLLTENCSRLTKIIKMERFGIFFDSYFLEANCNCCYLMYLLLNTLIINISLSIEL
jgi:hypothetical protein